jgi:hypothetical protein
MTTNPDSRRRWDCRLATGWACPRTIGPRIHTSPCDGASARCDASNRLDRLSAFCPFTPPSTTRSMSNAISLPATRSAFSEARRSRRGGRRPRPEPEPRPLKSLTLDPSSRDSAVNLAEITRRLKVTTAVGRHYREPRPGSCKMPTQFRPCPPWKPSWTRRISGRVITNVAPEDDSGPARGDRRWCKTTDQSKALRLVEPRTESNAK